MVYWQNEPSMVLGHAIKSQVGMKKVRKQGNQNGEKHYSGAFINIKLKSILTTRMVNLCGTESPKEKDVKSSLRVMLKNLILKAN